MQHDEEELIMFVHVLSDGVKVIQSDRKSNRSGYQGAAFSPAWTLDSTKPFVAASGNPKDPAIRNQLRAQHRTAWHGGYYADAREAAYVVGRFKIDPVGTEDRIYEQGGAWQDFPADLYSLPVTLTAAEAIAIIKEQSVACKHRKKVSTEKSTLNFGEILHAVGIALKGLPRDNKFVKETLWAQMPWFTSVEDAVGLALELVRR
jgi:hypothetical protein